MPWTGRLQQKKCVKLHITVRHVKLQTFHSDLVQQKHTRETQGSEGCPRTDLGEKPGSIFPQGQLLQETLHSMPTCRPSNPESLFLTLKDNIFGLSNEVGFTFEVFTK